ncbi:MAG TPA: TonB-dependent receptor [Paludibaculum sp.]
MKLRKLTTILVFILAVSLPIYAQAVNGTILGTVTDSSGGSVPNTKITLTETNTGVNRTATTNESGNYIFPDVPPGMYSVTAELTGFKKMSRAGIELQVNTSPRVDLTLQPGNVTEVIEVSAQAAMLQTETASTGSQIATVQTENLPLSTNRNYQGLLNLVPGTTRASFQHSQFFNAASSLQTQVNGQLRQGNNYQIEGIDNNERTGLLQVITPPIEAIQNVDMATSNFDAELGRAAGAVTNVILKSGTNDIHGAAYYFHRNSSLNARNYFDAKVGHQAYNYWGGNAGGAIIKNKLFYFGDYLRITDHQANTNTLSIPASDLRTGNLGRSATPIYDPLTGNPDGSGRTAFADNIIPTSRVNAISTKLLALVPTPTSAGDTNNWFGLLPFTKDTDSMDWKMDYNISDKDRLTGRFSFARPVVFQAPAFGLAGSAAQSAFQGTAVQKTYSAGLNYNRIFSTTLVSEFRVGVSHYNNKAQNSDYGTTASKDIGIPGVNLDEFSSGLVGINLNGGYSGPMVGYSASLPWVRAEVNASFVNTWTKTKGNHTIKWGADIRRIRDELLQMQTFSPRGVYNFSDGQTSTPGAKTSFMNNMASFLLDVPSQAGRDLATYFPAYRAWQSFFFVQDRWTVTPKLTLSVGIRYELYPPATPRLKAGFSNYDPYANTLSVAGVGDIPMNLGIKNHTNYWSPRLGIAYRLNEKTVVRSGLGVSYTPFPDNSYAYNYPVRANNAFNPAVATYGAAVLPDGSTATFQKGFPAPILVPIPTNGIITNPDKNSNYFVVNQDFKNPHVISWNFAIQRQLPWHFALDTAYIGNHSVNTVMNYNMNAATVVGKGNLGQPQFGPFGRTASTNILYAGYSSMYHAFQMKLDRRFSTGLSVTTAYTFSKGMAFQQGDDGGAMFNINFRRNYARNDFDRTQTFVQSYIYDLPFGKGKKWLNSGLASTVIGGWRMNGILTLMTGTPLNFSASGNGLNAPGNSQTPDQIAPITLPKGIAFGNEWFSRSSFAVPVGAVFGTVGRNAMSGPGFFNLDFSLFKIFAITERMKMEIRAESFGVTNTPQFSNPNTALGNASFGFITGAGGGRQMQIGAKFNF